MDMYYLMIKEIEQTGWKYLCKKKQCKDPTAHLEYSGSGKLWKRALSAHPEYTIKTTVLGLYSKEDLQKYGEIYSNFYNVVESEDWANLIPELGDGGITHKNTHPFLNPSTGSIVYREVCPDGYVPYKHNKLSGYRTVYNPKTNKCKRIPPGEPLPQGFVWGNIPGRGYGPKKNETTVYNNGKRKIYLKKEDPVPDGFSPGLHYSGTTANRIACHDPIMGKKKYVKKIEDMPEGYVVGLPPTTGKRVLTPFGVYETIAKAVNSLNVSRFQIMKKVKEEPQLWKILNEDSWQQGRSIKESLTK